MSYIKKVSVVAHRVVTLVFFLLTGLVGSKAFDFEVDGVCYNIISLSEKTVYVSGFTSHGDVVIPENVKYNNYEFSVDSLGSLFDGERTSSIKFSKKINTSGHILYGCGTAYFYVDSENPYMTAVDGVLYSKDMKRLICYPPYKSGENFNIPESVSSIDDYAFGANRYLRKLIFNNNIEELPENFLYGTDYSGGVTELSLSDKIKVIYGRCLDSMNSIKVLKLPKDLKEIKKDPSWGYYGLPTSPTDITISNSKIANYTYSLQPSLYVFSRFTNLSNLYVNDTNPVALEDNIFTDGDFFTINLYVPLGTKETYKITEGWKNFYNIIEENFESGDVYYNLNIFSYEGGTTSIKGQNIDNENSSISVKEGESVTLSVTPKDGYCLKSLIVNGTDVINEVKNNIYTIPSINQITTVEVYFEELPPYLTIKSADNGYVSQKANKGDTYSFIILSNDGWEIESISFNGSDVTEQMEGNKYTTPTIMSDSELCIVYKKKNINSINSTRSKTDIKVFASNGTISIQNNGTATNATVYDTSGHIAISKMIGTGISTIELPTNNIYIAKVGHYTFKLAL